MGGGKISRETSRFWEGTDQYQAAQSMATAQDRAAKRAYQETEDILRPASTAALLQYDRAIAAQDRNLGRQEQLIAQIDPAIMEASQQALRLLRGEQAQTLGPLTQQREQQRQKLLNQLREQLGPGAETSSAGLQALNRFDTETGQLYSGAQQQAIANLGGLMGQFTSARPDMLREAGGLAQLGEGRFGTQERLAQGLFGARQPMLGTAGSQYAGQLLQGQRTAAYGAGFHESGQKVGEAWSTMGMSSKSGGGGRPTSGGGSNTTAGGSYLDRGNIA